MISAQTDDTCMPMRQSDSILSFMTDGPTLTSTSSPGWQHPEPLSYRITPMSTDSPGRHTTHPRKKTSQNRSASCHPEAVGNKAPSPAHHLKSSRDCHQRAEA